MENKYRPKEKAWRWIKYGVVPSFFPIILAILYDIYLEYTISQIISRHFLDLILIVFAISVSIWGNATDLNNNIDSKKREKYTYTSVVLCLVCFAFYGFLYNKDTGNLSFMIILRIGFIISAILIVDNGFHLESEESSEQETEN